MKSLERRMEGCKVGVRDRETPERDGSQEGEESEKSAPEGSGTVCRGGVSLNTEASPEDTEDDPDNKSPSLSSNPTPTRETWRVSGPDMGSEGGGRRGRVEAGSLLGSGAVAAACWESGGGSCRQVEEEEGSAESHRGEEAKEEGGETGGRSPLDSGCVVCKRTPNSRTFVVEDAK